MRDSAATLHRVGDQRRIGDIADNQFNPRIVQRQVAALAGRQIIQNAYRVALGEQGIGEVRANETGATGD